MKYVFLAYQDERHWDALPASERDAFEKACQANDQDLRQSGRLFAAESRQSSRAAITVRVAAGGTMLLADGPAVGAQGQFIRLFFVNARDLNEAIRVASKMPQARSGPIEVRPIVEFDDY